MCVCSCECFVLVYPTVSWGPPPQGWARLILSSSHTFLHPRSLTALSEIGTKPTEPALIKKNSTFARLVSVRLYFVSLAHRLWFNIMFAVFQQQLILFNLLISAWTDRTIAINTCLSVMPHKHKWVPLYWSCWQIFHLHSFKLEAADFHCHVLFSRRVATSFNDSHSQP